MSDAPRGPGSADPELIAPLVQACPAVAGLHGGTFGEVATYLPGRRVRGVRVGDGGVEIHVVGRYPATVVDIAGQVRAAVTAAAGPVPVDVTIGDLALPGEPDPDDAIVYDPIRPAAPSPGAAAEPVAVAPGAASVRAPSFPPPTTEVAADPAVRRAPADRLDP